MLLLYFRHEPFDINHKSVVRSFAYNFVFLIFDNNFETVFTTFVVHKRSATLQCFAYSTRF